MTKVFRHILTLMILALLSLTAAAQTRPHYPSPGRTALGIRLNRVRDAVRGKDLPGEYALRMAVDYDSVMSNYYMIVTGVNTRISEPLAPLVSDVWTATLNTALQQRQKYDRTRELVLVTSVADGNRGYIISENRTKDGKFVALRIEYYNPTQQRAEYVATATADPVNFPETDGNPFDCILTVVNDAVRRGIISSIETVQQQ